LFLSTCFGSLHAHHQELITALTAFGFTLERGGSSAVGRGLAGPARPRPIYIVLFLSLPTPTDYPLTCLRAFSEDRLLILLYVDRHRAALHFLFIIWDFQKCFWHVIIYLIQCSVHISSNIFSFVEYFSNFSFFLKASISEVCGGSRVDVKFFGYEYEFKLIVDFRRISGTKF
jgi:hypothetical protein